MPNDRPKTTDDDGLSEADFDEIAWYQLMHLGAHDERTTAVREAVDARDYRRALQLVGGKSRAGQ